TWRRLSAVGFWSGGRRRRVPFGRSSGTAAARMPARARFNASWWQRGIRQTRCAAALQPRQGSEAAQFLALLWGHSLTLLGCRKRTIGDPLVDRLNGARSRWGTQELRRWLGSLCS